MEETPGSPQGAGYPFAGHGRLGDHLALFAGTEKYASARYETGFADEDGSRCNSPKYESVQPGLFYWGRTHHEKTIAAYRHATATAPVKPV